MKMERVIQMDDAVLCEMQEDLKEDKRVEIQGRTLRDHLLIAYRNGLGNGWGAATRRVVKVLHPNKARDHFPEIKYKDDVDWVDNYYIPLLKRNGVVLD
jgi:hypothetical protein